MNITMKELRRNQNEFKDVCKEAFRNARDSASDHVYHVVYFIPEENEFYTEPHHTFPDDGIKGFHSGSCKQMKNESLDIVANESFEVIMQELADEGDDSI